MLEVLLRAMLVQLLNLQMKRVKPVKLLGSALSTDPPALIMIRIVFAKQGGEMNNKHDICVLTIRLYKTHNVSNSICK